MSEDVRVLISDSFASRNDINFEFPCSQHHANVPYPESDESNPNSHKFLNIYFNIILPNTHVCQVVFLPLNSRIKMCSFLFACVACIAY